MSKHLLNNNLDLAKLYFNVTKSQTSNKRKKRPPPPDSFSLSFISSQSLSLSLSHSLAHEFGAEIEDIIRTPTKLPRAVRKEQNTYAVRVEGEYIIEGVHKGTKEGNFMRCIRVKGYDNIDTEVKKIIKELEEAAAGRNVAPRAVMSLLYLRRLLSSAVDREVSAEWGLEGASG